METMQPLNTFLPRLIENVLLKGELKMKRTIAALMLLIVASNVNAQSMNNDFGRSDSNEEVLSASDLRSRFELVGRVYVTDAKGQLMYQGNEARMWKFGSTGDLVSNWSYQAPGIKDIAIKHTWTFGSDGKMIAHIQQFESMKRKEKSREVETGKLIREEKIEVKDFAPINWIAHTDSKQRVVVRFSPELGDKTDYIEIDTLPMTINNPVVFDSKGRLWAQGRSLEGRYISMKTHMGQFSVSYVPFKGSKEIGYVKGSEMVINADKELKLYIRSDSPILTTSKPAKIFGLVDQSKKSERVNSVYSSSSSKEKEFLENIE